MKLIVRWSTYLNLFSCFEQRSITVLLPREVSALTKLHVIVHSSPSINSFTSALSFLASLSWAGVKDFNFSCKSSSLTCLRNETVKQVSPTLYRSSASSVMLIESSFLKWFPLSIFSIMSFDTCIVSPNEFSTVIFVPEISFTKKYAFYENHYPISNFLHSHRGSLATFLLTFLCAAPPTATLNM